MVGKARVQRKKPVHRPLKVRLDEAKKNLDRIQVYRDKAKAKYEQLHAKYLKSEQTEMVDAVNAKFKKGETLTVEEMDILRKVM